MLQVARDRIARREVWVFVLLWLVPSFYYLLLLTDGHFDLFRPITLGMTFNDMLAHLLRRQFDVSPEAIGYEGIVHDGRTYAYFGIYCALLRLPLVAISRLHDVDITVASVGIAASLSWLFRLLAIRLVLSDAPEKTISTFLAGSLVAAFALQGESIQFLNPTVYQEVIQWAGALGSLFVFLVVRLVTSARSSAFLMSPALAIVAGLALLARVSTGLGLYLAAGLMLLVYIARCSETAMADDRPGLHRIWDWQRAFVAVTHSSRFATISAILAFFVLCVCIVNYNRWGSPLTFADLRSQFREVPERLLRLERYGEFNFARLPWGAQYYFFPLWVLPGQQREFIDAEELPLGTFLLSDPVVAILSIAFVCLILRPGRRAALDIPYSLAAMTGLAFPPFLMLIAIYMTFRYRMEFYPLLDLMAFLGLFLVVQNRLLKNNAWLNPLIVSSTILGIVVAHLSLVLYKVSIGGPVWELDLSQGWSSLLVRQVIKTYPSLAWLFSGLAH